MRPVLLTTLHILLGAIDYPAIIVDGYGVVRDANQSGNALLKAGNIIALGSGDRLSVIDRHVAPLIRQVARSGDGTDSGAAEIDGPGTTTMHLAVIALPDIFADGYDPSVDAAPMRPVLITVRRPQPQNVDVQMLAASFALTSAQTRVLEKCLEGLGSAEIATSLGRSRHTVRSQLQAIYRKMGVHRLAELMALAKSSHDG